MDLWLQLIFRIREEGLRVDPLSCCKFDLAVPPTCSGRFAIGGNPFNLTRLVRVQEVLGSAVHFHLPLLAPPINPSPSRHQSRRCRQRRAPFALASGEPGNCGFFHSSVRSASSGQDNPRFDPIPAARGGRPFQQSSFHISAQQRACS